MALRWFPSFSVVFVVLAAWAGSCGAADSGPKSDAASTQQYDFGMVFQAQGGSVKNVSGTVTVPADWPGQQRVRVVKEVLPPGATVTYKKIEDVGRQMMVRVPFALPGREVRAVVTFEVQRLVPPPMPQDTEHFSVPKRQKQTVAYLSPSPRIESDAAPVRKAAEAAVGDRQNAWDQVKAIHEWVYQNIKFAGGLENVQTAVKTLSLRTGVCAEKNSLAVAMLRAQGMPARLVRIPGHCYYEVYLLDGEGQGHWFSGDASTAATISPSGAAMGMILQKGDNVSIIDPTTKKKTKSRFLAETAGGTPQSRGATMQFQPISPAIGAKPVVPKE
jgi:hypothetical protein